MKKLRIALLSTVIVVGMASAFATRFDPACASYPQYYAFDNTYYEAGDYGWDYTCEGTIGYCTYYRPQPGFFPNWYVPCRTGDYTLQ